jgi:hypothetical protein
MIVNPEIIELKTNHILKGLVPLEMIFDNNVIYVKPSIQALEEVVVNCNLGTDNDPRFVKLSKDLSNEQRKKYVNLMKEFFDIFAWKYEDLKTYDKSIIQQKIPLNPNTNPFKKKLRHVNPIFPPIIEKEVKNFLDGKIIVPLIFSYWVANLVPRRKKNEEIRLCADFKNLSKCSLKYNYPLLKMDHVLQKVVGAKRSSMIDGFFWIQ